MVLVNLLLLVGVILFSVIGGLIGAKKAVGRKAVNLGLLIASFFVAVLVLSSGAFDFVGNLVAELIMEGETGMETVSSLVSGLINFFIKVFIFDILFWVGYGLLKIIVLIVISIAKVNKTQYFVKPKKEDGANVVAGVLGGVTAWFFCLLSLLPIFALSSLLSTAVVEASKEEYSDTYAYELAETFNEEYTFLTDKSYVNYAAKFTGARGLVNFALKSFGKSEIVIDGNANEYNVYSLFKEVATLGVDGVILYERSMTGGHTYGEMHVVVDMVETCAGSPALVSLSAVLVQSADVGGEGVLGEVLSSVTNGAENLQNDILVIKNILENFFEKNKDKEFTAEHLSEDLVEYILDQQNADQIVDNVCRLSSFKNVTAVLSSYGIFTICEMMEIPENKEDALEMLYQDLLTEVNDRSVSKINFSDLDGFIDYLSDNQIKVEDYREQNRDQETGEDDVAILNYDEYFERSKKIIKTLDCYKVETLDDKTVYYADNGEIYVYDNETDLWSSALNDTNLKTLEVFAKYLISKADTYIQNEQEINREELISLINDFQFALSGGEHVAFNQEYSKKISNEENFTTELITEEVVLSKVDKNADVTNGSNALKEILLTASVVLSLGESDGDVAGTLLANFSQVGKVLDALSNFGVTKEVPEVLLKAIAQNKNYSSYFAFESIVKITNNVKNGTSTYTELFTAIQSLYEIANELL